MADSPDFTNLDRESIYIAGYQVNPGDDTTPVGPAPIDQVDYTRDLEDAHRVLYRVDGVDGNVHWYWMTGGITDADDAAWRIVDLQRSGGYPELGE